MTDWTSVQLVITPHLEIIARGESWFYWQSIPLSVPVSSLLVGASMS